MAAFANGTLISTTGEDIAIEKITTESIEFLDTKQDNFLLCINIEISSESESVHVSTNTGENIVCSTTTEFYVLDKGWVNSKNLSVLDKLVCPTGDSVQYVTSASVESEEITMNSINIGSEEEELSGWKDEYSTLGHFAHDVLVK
jgi:hypothetical protein